MQTPLTARDAVILGPDPSPIDPISAVYDPKTQEIVVHFGDGKVAKVQTNEFEELANAGIQDFECLDATRAGVTCITDTVDFAVAASWWRAQVIE